MSDNPESAPTYKSPSFQVHESVSAWFLGPQAENAELLKELFSRVVADHVAARTSFHPEDGEFITSAVKESRVYQQTVDILRKKLSNLSALLNDFSIPFYSPRYGAHMTFESSLPSIVGWLAAMLLNPNNVSFEAGPITTLLELEVGQDLCKMIGFQNVDDMQSWGHLTCDGTVANIEAIWHWFYILLNQRTARNLKFYPLALREAMRPNCPLHFVADNFIIAKCKAPKAAHLFKDLDTWELLNLRPDDILEIPDRLSQEYGISPHFLETTMSKYIVQSVGMEGMVARWEVHQPPKFLIASTKHYSWAKGIALAGIGSENLINIPVDHNARIDLDELRHRLDHCLNNHEALYAVVATIGTTEEGAVDPLAKIIELREEYQAKGLSFVIHADAAWGGYFASTLRDPPVDWDSTWPATESGQRTPFDQESIPFIALKHYTVHQLENLRGADSVTVDPHKSGYCPYPAGGLCYRDRRMRHLLTWSAPYIEHGKRGENLGIHGVEGSKPGAAAAAVYMHHSVIGLHKQGHGGLLGEVSFTCARIAAYWATMSSRSTRYVVVPFNKLRFEPHEDAVELEKDFISRKILGRSNEEIVQDPDPEIMTELRSLGSDLNINAFVCNFRLRSLVDPDAWVINEDVEEANYLNRYIFDRLSVTDMGQNPRTTPMFLSSTVLKSEDYGECLDNLKRRAGLETQSRQDMFVLRNVVMSPFQAAAEFVEQMSATFKGVVEDSMDHVVAKNTITPQIHKFLMQGTDRLYLAYRPLFHKANGRQQLILEVNVPDTGEWLGYLDARKAQPNAIFMLSTESMTIDDLLAASRIRCVVSINDEFVLNLTIATPRIVKNRTLLSRWRDLDYDAQYTPFYLYGTASQRHIDHMLLKAPNAQLAAEDVTLTLDHPIPPEKLETGVLLFVNRPERSMQPFDRDSPPYFFYSDARHKVMVCDDPFPAVAHGPGLAAASRDHPVIARGTMKLPLNVFCDYTELNREDFRGDERITQRMSEGMNWEDKSAWRAMVLERLHLPVSDYYCTRRERVDGKFNDGHDVSRPEDEKAKEKAADDDVRGAALFPSEAMQIN